MFRSPHEQQTSPELCVSVAQLDAQKGLSVFALLAADTLCFAMQPEQVTSFNTYTHCQTLALLLTH